MIHSKPLDLDKDWQQIVQAEVYDPLELRYPDRPRNLAQIFMSAAETYEDKTAIIHDGQQITYGDFAQSVIKAAHVLRYQFGIEAGDRVAILLGTEVAFAISIWAAASIGAVVCPMNVRYQPPELKYQLSHSAPRMVIAGSDIVDRLLLIRGELPSVEFVLSTIDEDRNGVLPFNTLTSGTSPSESPFRQVDETAPAFIFYTSGTTGRPKGVVNSQRSLIYSIHAAHLADGQHGSPDIMCIPIPLHYTGGCKSFLSLTSRGGTCIFLKQWKINDLLRAVQEYRVTNLFALGTIWSLAVVSPEFADYDLTSIRTILFGGSATAPSVIERVRRAMPRAQIIQGYGMTECNSGTVETDPIERPTSSGVPSGTTQIRVVDRDDLDVPANEVGQILIRNAQIFSGYWKDDEATENAMRGGWYRTGDMGYLDDEGRLHVAGRIKDMIIRGQENIYPAEIESAIMRHPAVAEVAVLGIPDEIFGEQVKAVIVPREDQSIDEEEILALCRKELAEFKVPRFVLFRKQPLPRNPGGKVMKADLL